MQLYGRLAALQSDVAEHGVDFAPTAQQLAVQRVLAQRLGDAATRFADLMTKALPAFAAELHKAALKDVIAALDAEPVPRSGPSPPPGGGSAAPQAPRHPYQRPEHNARDRRGEAIQPAIAEPRVPHREEDRDDPPRQRGDDPGQGVGAPAAGRGASAPQAAHPADPA